MAFVWLEKNRAAADLMLFDRPKGVLVDGTKGLPLASIADELGMTVADPLSIRVDLGRRFAPEPSR